MSKILLLLLLAVIVASSTTSCEVDSDCSRYNTCVNGSCKRKDLFPLEPMEILGTVLIFVCAALSNAAGQSGGPLMTLILLAVFMYQTSLALPMVQLIILGGSGTGLLLRIPVRHPTRNRPVIDYYLFALFSSPLLIGTTIGVMLNLIFPSWLILALLTVVLSYITYTSASMSIKIYKKENAEKLKITDDALITEEEKPTIVDESSIEITPELKKIIDSEKRMFPLVPCLIFLLMYTFAVVSAFIKGSAYSPSIIGISQCTSSYWLLLAGIFTVYILFTIVMACYISYITKKKLSLGYNFDSYDLV